MINIRPRSFLNLVTGGLIIVSLPLVVGLFTTRNHLDKLVSQSVSLIERSVATTRDAQELGEYMRDLERNIRLFDIVGEERYLIEAAALHDHIHTLLVHLQQLPLDQNIHELLIQFQARVEVILSSLHLAHRGPEAQEKNIADVLISFSYLDKSTMIINNAINTFMDTELTKLKNSKLTAQKTLVWQTLSFIAMTVVMILALAYIILDPIKQVNRGIERLGKGDFSTPISIIGPRDLEGLGEKLDWLRGRLANLEREKTKFIAHISHELKTPLTSIMEGSGLLREELIGPLNEEQLAVTRILIKNSVKLRELIENILNFNMAKAGGTPKGQKHLSLKPVIEQVAFEQTTKMLAKDLKLDLHLRDATILGDKKQIETIFENLFSNAVKFAEPGGVICCSLRQIPEEVKCLVSNTGLAIPPAEQDKIFTPFYQVKKIDQSHTAGSGLGLGIVKEYVLQHNGSISVLDRTSGACFMVIFPSVSNKNSSKAIT